MRLAAFALLDEIQGKRERRARHLPPPATPEELRGVQEAAAQQLGYTLPATYLALLARCNGVDHNGTQIYGTHDLLHTEPNGRITYDRMGLVEANLLWRDFPPNKDFVFLAETGDVLYRHNLSNGRFEVVDRVGGDTDNPDTDAYDTLAPLLERIFHQMLNHHDVASK